jgi:hypothetical protein
MRSEGAFMPTEESWIVEHIAATRWTEPLTADELTACFNALTAMIRAKPHLVHVLFDLREAGIVPARAPIIAIQSGMFSTENTGSIAVVSTDVLAELLASVASRKTRHPIRFFKTFDDAVAFLAWAAGTANT